MHRLGLVGWLGLGLHAAEAWAPAGSRWLLPSSLSNAGRRRCPLPPASTLSSSSSAEVVKPWPTRAQEVVDKGGIEALRVRHILCQSQDMAEALMRQIKDGADFGELAKAISDCELTRDKGGEVGWVGLNDDHMDELLSRSAREKLMDYKPGDVCVAETERGVHLIQIEDVLAKLSRRRRNRGRMAGKGESYSTLSTKPGGKYFTEVMGCQMNVADLERMEGQLHDLGWDRADRKEDANLLLLNTCSIRDHAEQKVYSFVGQHAARKKKGEDLTIVVAGCVAQQEGEKLLQRVPEIDLVMGPQYVNRLGDLLEDVASGSQVVATDPTLIMEDISKPRRGSSVCAWVNIIYGCNENCSYCVVPGVRGVEQSRPRESIRAEIEELVAEGYKEICLLGQNVDVSLLMLSAPLSVTRR
jgi:hypothetical protein